MPVPPAVASEKMEPAAAVALSTMEPTIDRKEKSVMVGQFSAAANRSHHPDEGMQLQKQSQQMRGEQSRRRLWRA
jgi:hypothetical protein